MKYASPELLQFLRIDLKADFFNFKSLEDHVEG
jgi:hypothetical protein